GQIIAWVTPAHKGGAPFTIRTRAATASIVGTTVFIEASADSLKVFSWEGHVRVETTDGHSFDLHSGEQLSVVGAVVQPITRLTPEQAATRRRESPLLNGFSTSMETLPLIERELGISAGQPSPYGSGTPPAR
ncbi:MAG: hypothetical protein ACKO0M_10775, partial [Cyanobium sp.]